MKSLVCAPETCLSSYPTKRRAMSVGVEALSPRESFLFGNLLSFEWVRLRRASADGSHFLMGGGGYKMLR